VTTSNPWEVAPIPAGGDEHEDITFVSVGRALTRWELFESNFSFVFQICVTDNAGLDLVPARRAYGSILTFRGRAEMTKAAFDAYVNILSHKRENADLVEIKFAFSSLLKLGLAAAVASFVPAPRHAPGRIHSRCGLRPNLQAAVDACRSGQRAATHERATRSTRRAVSV
jgi:hypothetical protein